ncbi:MAG: hypothetical protein Q4D54_06915 [Eubacteriales bacterium]|nr:hypothetical protein [Lachnospiraceae bacterium]MDO5127461.1 hypothetical protein [Eubacteriales bacterium]
MELKYGYLVIASIAVSVITLILQVLLRKRTKSYGQGEKIYNMAFMENHPYLKRRKRLHKVLSVLTVLCLATGITATGVLAARPFKSRVEKENKYARDIILCMDISTTVDEMNKTLTGELIETVRSLKGERFGIVIFNTSPVLVCPLTDDYEFVIEQLENINKALELRIKVEQNGIWDDDYFYWNEYISAGTLVGNEERGSSIIGDGLASCVYHFSNREKDRTRLVIFTSDNEVYGTEIYDLPEAAELCRDNDITVYGIGTEIMATADMEEMKASVELTGGKFYLEENEDTFSNIIDDIQSHSSSLVEGDTYIIETDYPKMAFLVALVATVLMFLSIRILKK